MEVLSLILLLFVGSSLQASTPGMNNYVAGVVEFNFEQNPNISEAIRTQTNLEKYVKIMEDAEPSLDIIVFPEMTLNSMETAVETPEPKELIAPCDTSSYPQDNIIKKMSCAAKNFKRYVVVNVVTKAKCPDEDMTAHEDPRDCKAREDEMSYYNTNIVFDRNGTLISRYRKFNLFGEEVDKPSKPSLITFDTDFGVKFGHFVCFDLMFRSPALELIRTKNVTDIIFPTMWFSELPFLTGVQVQQNWAYANNVNLLAAGANRPEVGSTGTGIYSGKFGSLISVMEGKANTTLYVASVPKKDRAQSTPDQKQVKYDKNVMKPLKLKRDQLDKYEIQFLDNLQMSADNKIKTSLCSNGVCCDFTYSYTTLRTDIPYYRYALAAYHGSRTFDGFADGGVVACAVLACQTTDVATCGIRNETMQFVHKWNSLHISANVPFGDEFLYMPTSLDESIMPFRVEEFDYKESSIGRYENEVFVVKEYLITMQLSQTTRNFYAFGVYGRDFSLDAFGASSSVQISVFLVVILAGISLSKSLF